MEGQEIGDLLEDYRGLDEEGQIRGAWKRMTCECQPPSALKMEKWNH
jgi:hypothetical protein